MSRIVSKNLALRAAHRFLQPKAGEKSEASSDKTPAKKNDSQQSTPRLSPSPPRKP
jgi:hypothetical protein